MVNLLRKAAWFLPVLLTLMIPGPPGTGPTGLQRFRFVNDSGRVSGATAALVRCADDLCSDPVPIQDTADGPNPSGTRFMCSVDRCEADVRAYLPYQRLSVPDGSSSLESSVMVSPSRPTSYVVSVGSGEVIVLPERLSFWHVQAYLPGFFLGSLASAVFISLTGILIRSKVKVSALDHVKNLLRGLVPGFIIAWCIAPLVIGGYGWQTVACASILYAPPLRGALRKSGWRGGGVSRLGASLLLGMVGGAIGNACAMMPYA